MERPRIRAFYERGALHLLFNNQPLPPMSDKNKTPEGWIQVKDTPAFVKFCEGQGRVFEEIPNAELHKLAKEFRVFQIQQGEA